MAAFQSLNFNPTSISGCALWLDASDPSTILYTGGNVSQWNDKSGNGRNTSTVYGAPRVSFAGGFGSRPALYFGSNSGFTGSNSNTGTTVTAFVVGRINTSNTGQRFLSLGQPGRFDFGTSTDIVALTTGNLTSEFGWYRNFVGVGNGSAFVTTVYNSPFIYSVNVNGSTGVIVYNGSTTSSGTTSGSFGYTTYGVAAGFSTSPTPGSFLTDGFIAEILVYNASFSQIQRQTIEGYLAWKWGLQGSLPTTHPFYNIAPNSANLPYPVNIPVPVPNQAFASSTTPLVFFNPTSIAGCQLWLDAMDVNGNRSVVANGVSLSNWVDKSGSGFSMSNTSGANLPTYSVGGLGGWYPSLVFTAAGASYLRNTASSLFNGAAWDMYSVIRVADPTAHQAVLIEWPSGNYIWTAGAAGTTNFTYFVNPNWVLGPSTGPNLTTSQIYQIYSTGSQVGRRINAAFAGNGTDQVVSYSNAARSGTRTLGVYSMGSLWSGANLTAGEILVFNSALSTTQREQVEGYLAWKWGLVSSLPGNHPFRNSPPGLSVNLAPSLGRLQGTSFSPRNISSCVLWLDAADNSTLTLGGANITSWADKSGNGRNATPTGTVTYSINGFNSSYPTLSQTSGAFAVSMPSNSMPNGMTGFSVMRPSGQTYYIGRPTIGSIPRPIDSFSTSANRRLIGNGTQYWEVTMSGGYSFATVSNVIYNFQVLTTIQWVEWVNGSPSPVSGSVFNNGATYSDASTTLQIAVQGLNCEHIIYDGILNTAQRQSVEGYLAWKWGLQGSLPASHPFKLFPPPPN